MNDTANQNIPTTDAWPWSKIIKAVLLPKPKGAPKAGKKEIGLRIGCAVVFGIFAYSMFTGGSLPSCGSSDAKSLVEKIVNDMPVVKFKSIKFVTLKEIEELGFNKKSEIRSCNATLITTAGEDTVQYSIKWQEKSKKTFYVTAEIQ